MLFPSVRRSPKLIAVEHPRSNCEGGFRGLIIETQGQTSIPLNRNLLVHPKNGIRSLSYSGRLCKNIPIPAHNIIHL